MAKDKLIPTWLKVAAVAALFVPYSIKLEKDEEKKIKKVSARSVAARVVYTPKTEEKEADLNVSIPGNAKDKEGEGFSFDSEVLVEGAKRLYDTASAKAKVYADKTVKGVSAFYEAFIADDTEESAKPEAEELDLTV